MTYVIREGDRTTTDGFVIRASGKVVVQSRKLARMGDLVWCPGCERVGFIAEGNPTYIDHYVAVATQGQTVRCECSPGSHRLLASADSVPADMDATVSIPPDLAEIAHIAAERLLSAIQAGTLGEHLFSPLRPPAET
ncbi:MULTISPECIES: PAAR domain-containing protein [unclassified Pseudomonas]|uniref:PAAR domain-containing protein n=1 Tax=unclassified Pseudomonas TaxID=196821 RepID=UPI002AC9450B|nr:MULTISPECIES: PAAR domain-containing protein [unclassified Pseudomonas]MEB0040224.1 PAAR domain-containing protein [Pseudomonas sp. MH10]MEB0079040.1 PAAR domain-containing protein [Pseudomonas sp. MH10out]MEB0090581.1 PAAR domain-containing protein [Pseudomonas sp. CCI4.2]MEB0102158.1 PAAR domain-containing protein [Pseudomonas sp. CCI3.2]MEB0119941.1 PAAR domain-containing protein [Pseudomonas sp. CCI1.2]